jgi:response regulator of citrate/malate metabolism
VDAGTLERVIGVVRSAKTPLNVGEIAEIAEISRPTASKYIQIAKAMGKLETWPDATQQLVAIAGKGGRGHRGKGP